MARKKQSRTRADQAPNPPQRGIGKGGLALLLFTVGAAAVVGASAVMPVVAQDDTGVEIKRLREEAKSMSGEVGDFTRELQRRGEDAREDALAVQEGAERNLEAAQEIFDGQQAGEGEFDMKDITAEASRVRKGGMGGAKGPAFIAFASMSMPPAALRQMAKDVTSAGGFMVFRGFPNNDAKQFAQALTKVFEKGQSTGNIGIDPRLFRAFHVDVVPTYVVTTNEIELCDGLACVSEVPPHDRLQGNVTSEYALQTIAQGGGPGASAARVYLQKVEKGRG